MAVHLRLVLFFAILSCSNVFLTLCQSDVLRNAKMNTKLDRRFQLRCLVNLSLEKCTRECVARLRCRCISYKSTAHVCILGFKDSTGNSSVLLKGQGYLYSERKYWTKVQDTGCQLRCRSREACIRTFGQNGRCEVQECGPPPNIAGTFTIGNLHTIGARIKFVCSLDPFSWKSSHCQRNGLWYFSTSSVCRTDIPPLEGKKFHITSNLTNKWWHTDASKNDEITTKWGQGASADSFTEFSFIKLNNSSNRFLIRRNSSEMYVADTGTQLVAKPLTLPIPGRKFVLMRSGKAFRIFCIHSQRFVHVDATGLLTTTGNFTDDSSVFRFEELQP